MAGTFAAFGNVRISSARINGVIFLHAIDLFRTGFGGLGKFVEPFERFGRVDQRSGIVGRSRPAMQWVDISSLGFFENLYIRGRIDAGTDRPTKLPVHLAAGFSTSGR